MAHKFSSPGGWLGKMHTGPNLLKTPHPEISWGGFGASVSQESCDLALQMSKVL